MGCREQKRRKSTIGCEDEHGWLNFEANANLLDQSKAKHTDQSTRGSRGYFISDGGTLPAKAFMELEKLHLILCKCLSFDRMHTRLILLELQVFISTSRLSLLCHFQPRGHLTQIPPIYPTDSNSGIHSKRTMQKFEYAYRPLSSYLRVTISGCRITASLSEHLGYRVPEVPCFSTDVIFI